MASFRRKPSGRWEARYRDARGSMHAQTFPTKTAAVSWAKEVETDVRRGDWIDPRRARIRQWSEDYLETIVHLRAVTRRDYERQLRVHILPALGDCPISHIEQVDVRRFIADLLATGMAPKTLQKVRLVLRQVFETARGSGAIRSNPCEGIRLPRAQAKEPIFLSPEQVDQLGAYLADRASTAGVLTGADFVFTAPEGGPLRRDLLHKRIFRPAVQAAGLPEALRMHDLRHTCTALLIALIRRSSRSGWATGRSPSPWTCMATCSLH